MIHTVDEPTTIPAGTIKRLHVQQHNIKKNHKDGGNRPVFSIQMSAGVKHTNRVDINGPSSLVWNEEKPLSCGARAWIETKAEITIHPHEEIANELRTPAQQGS